MGERRRWGEAAVGLACAVAAQALLARMPARAQPSGTPPPSDAGATRPTSSPPGSVVDHRFEVRLDPDARVVHGEGTVRWRNTSRRPQDELWVHLYLNGFRDDRSLFRREDDGGFRGAQAGAPGSIVVDWFEVEGRDLWPEEPHSPDDEEDATDVRVALAEPVPPGGSVVIELSWRSTMPALQARSGYHGSFFMVAQWFPKLARLEPDGTWAHFAFHPLSEFYADFGRYDVTIDVPEGWVVGATGAQEGGELRFVAEGVHDFAFAAWDRFVETERVLDDGTRLRCLHPPDTEREAAEELDAVAHALPLFEEAYGDYPYPQLTIVHPPEGAAPAGGMEYPTLITTGRGGVAERLGARSLATVTVHELAHQWFYGMLASDEHAWPFLDEGLATYATAWALEARYPDASVWHGLGMRLGWPAVHRLAALRTPAEGPIARAAPDFESGEAYAAQVYFRTATLLETLRRVYGEPVEAALERYAAQARFSHPTPNDLLAAFSEAAGPRVAGHLREGLFGDGTVDFAVDAVGQEGGAHRVVVRRDGALDLPVEVEVSLEDGTRRQWQWQDGPPMVWRGPAPVAVVVDPRHRILLDDDLRNNHWKARPSRVAPRVLALGGAVAALVAAWALP